MLQSHFSELIESIATIFGAGRRNASREMPDERVEV